jgi:hypothetical protein
MRIAHIANYFMPEFGYQEHYLAKKHAELGHDVHVITSNRTYPAHEEYQIFSETYPDRIVPSGIYPGIRVTATPSTDSPVTLKKTCKSCSGG